MKAQNTFMNKHILNLSVQISFQHFYCLNYSIYHGCLEKILVVERCREFKRINMAIQISDLSLKNLQVITHKLQQDLQNVGFNCIRITVIQRLHALLTQKIDENNYFFLKLKLKTSANSS